MTKFTSILSVYYGIFLVSAEAQPSNEGVMVYNPPPRKGVGCFDEVGALVEAQSKYKTIQHHAKLLRPPCRVRTKRDSR
jgi:hypothetical protein